MPERGLDSAATKVLVGLVTQAAVLTAVLFYFGWARVRATYAYFGIEVSALNFSVSDYVLRSVGATFPLLVATGLLVVCLILINDHLRIVLEGHVELVERRVRILLVLGWTLVAAGLILALTVTGTGGSALPGPAAMLAGFATIVYALMLRNRYGIPNESRLVIIVAGLLILAFLWTVTAYADFIGVQVAKHLQAALPKAPNVIVYSSRDLSLAGPGVTKSKIASLNAAYQFRYSGLRLLISSGNRYFLLPVGWRQGTGSVIVLPVTPSGVLYRLQFQAQAP